MLLFWRAPRGSLAAKGKINPVCSESNLKKWIYIKIGYITFRSKKKETFFGENLNNSSAFKFQNQTNNESNWVYKGNPELKNYF